MTHYNHLTLSERVKIFAGLKNGESIRKIAFFLERSVSTIAREVHRNSDNYGYFYPPEAHDRAKKRKYIQQKKIGKINGLQTFIVEKLKQDWSPIAIAGKWSNDNQTQSIHPETIYRYIYSKEGKKLDLWKYLPRKKKKRGLIRRKTRGSTIKNRVSIHQRPESIDTRSSFGHYEADLFFNSGSKSANVLTVIERSSRMIFLRKNSTKSSSIVIQSVADCIGQYAQSVTFDNGTEFAEHTTLQDNQINTYFCDTGSPWQKGAVENANNMVRRYLPFEVKHHEITQKWLHEIENIINNTPRKTLNFMTPNEVFQAFLSEKTMCCTSE